MLVGEQRNGAAGFVIYLDDLLEELMARIEFLKPLIEGIIAVFGDKLAPPVPAGVTTSKDASSETLEAKYIQQPGDRELGEMSIEDMRRQYRVPPGDKLIRDMDAGELSKNYLRFVGAGCVTAAVGTSRKRMTEGTPATIRPPAPRQSPSSKRCASGEPASLSFPIRPAGG